MSVIDPLPEELRNLVQAALNSPILHWIERADLAKWCAVFHHGGIATDTFDQKLVDGAEALLELYRQVDPMCVPGNAIDYPGCRTEPDTLAASARHPLVAD